MSLSTDETYLSTLIPIIEDKNKELLIAELKKVVCLAAILLTYINKKELISTKWNPDSLAGFILNNDQYCQQIIDTINKDKQDEIEIYFHTVHPEPVESEIIENGDYRASKSLITSPQDSIELAMDGCESMDDWFKFFETYFILHNEHNHNIISTEVGAISFFYKDVPQIPALTFMKSKSPGSIRFEIIMLLKTGDQYSRITNNNGNQNSDFAELIITHKRTIIEFLRTVVGDL